MKTFTISEVTLWKKSLLLFSWLLFFVVLSVSAQQKTITGIITNADGAGVDRVSVLIKGTNRGTTTNNQGRFSLQASPNETLVISSVGFATQEIKVGNKTAFTIN